MFRIRPRKRAENQAVPAIGPFEVDDLVVLLLGAPGAPEPGKIEGITRLEKLLFLAEKETAASHWLTEPTAFGPNSFGPFSIKVYEAVRELTGAGLITDAERPADQPDEGWEEATILYKDEDVDPYKTRDLALTEKGWEYYKSLLDILPRGAETTIGKLKEFIGNVPIRVLVRYVYSRYPQYTVIEKHTIKSFPDSKPGRTPGS